MAGIVTILSAATGKVKRWEHPDPVVVAKVTKGSKIAITPAGKALGYYVDAKGRLAS